MEVRAWLGAGWWGFLPGGGVVEVQPAGAVQGFFRGAGVQAGWQDGVLVAVAAGEVDGKAPPAGRPAVAGTAGVVAGRGVHRRHRRTDRGSVGGGWPGRRASGSAGV